MPAPISRCPIRFVLFLSVGLGATALATFAALGAMLHPGAQKGSSTEVAPDRSSVTVTKERDGDEVHFYVHNDEFSEITMTFAMNLLNLKADVQFPYTMTFPARRVTEAFTLSPVSDDRSWEYSFTNYFKLGSNCARHDDSFVYQLPYAPGDKYKVTQGYNGRFSHIGSNQYATDWQMPEGTYVHAARGGVVVRAKDDSNCGGPSMDYDRFNNYVLIRHDDGTLGHYCHLQHGGCLVRVGQVVTTGQIIARSGNTGFSSGPHLHFCVFKTKNGRERISLPVKFRTTADKAVTLVSGHAYRSATVQSASAAPTLTASAPAFSGRAPAGASQ